MPWNIFLCVPWPPFSSNIGAYFSALIDLSFRNIKMFVQFSLNLIPCHVFAVVLAHTLPHTISFLMAQWSPDPMTCDVQMLSCLPGCLYPSVCLRSACVFIIYFAFWQKDFKTIILMFFAHTRIYTCRYRATDITSNWVGFIGKMLKCWNDFRQFLAFKCNFSLHLTLALSRIIRAKSKTLFNQTQTHKCKSNKSTM